MIVNLILGSVLFVALPLAIAWRLGRTDVRRDGAIPYIDPWGAEDLWS